MNNWVAGASIMYVLASIVIAVDNEWISNIFIIPFSISCIVITFVPCMIWGMFRHVVIPISRNRQNETFIRQLIEESKQIMPRIYWHHDKKANCFYKKFFLFRLEKF